MVSRAALTLGVPAGAGTRSVSVIFPGAPDRDRELASAPMPDAPWMFDVGARARRALRDGVLPQFRMRPPSTLVVFPATDVASAASARLLGEIARAIASTIDLAEREPRMIADVERERWTREPGARAAGAAASAGDSDGRWLWLAVLVLFAVEWRVRRHARVA